MKTMFRQVIFLMGVFAMCGVARADAPLDAPEKFENLSASGTAVAVSDPVARRVQVLSIDSQSGNRKPLWDFPEYLLSFCVADDGSTIVDDGSGNLLPVGVPDDAVLLRFIRQGKILREYSLKEIVARRDLKKTVSHLRWRHELMMDREGHLWINTESGERWFEVSTGKQIARPEKSSLFKR